MRAAACLLQENSKNRNPKRDGIGKKMRRTSLLPMTCERITLARVIPLLASTQGGVAEQSGKCREASADKRGRGGFPNENKKENHPGCVSFGGFAIFS